MSGRPPAVLPDLLRRGLTTVFCGSAAGRVSAEVGAPYAGPGNKFWPMLAETGLTPRRFAPQEAGLLAGLGIGLTDINKAEFGSDRDLTAAGDDPDALLRKIERFRPRLVAFTAKRPAQVFLGRKAVDYGPQAGRIGRTLLFVLPSPSGLAQYWWDPGWWHRLADLHRAERAGQPSAASSAAKPAR